MITMFMELDGWWDDDCTYHTVVFNNVPKPSRTKNKKANIFIKIKWFILILIWKFNNRKWKSCRQKTKAFIKYKETLMKGHK